MTLYLGYPLPRAMVLGAILSMLVGCGSTLSGNAPPTESPSVAKSPKVVVTSSVLCDLTRQLAAETIALTCLLEPGVDPHTYQLTPSDRKAIEDADLILMNGYGLEASLEPVVSALSAQRETVAVAEVAVPQPLRGAGHDAHEAGAGHDAHEAQAPDPHVWHNAEYGGQMVRVIQTSLAKLTPKQRDRLAAQAGALQAELAQLHTWIQAQIQTIPAKQRRLVTSHDALAYYADAYGMEVEGALQGISTEAKPAAGRLQALVDSIKASGVPTIFADRTDRTTLLATVAKDAGVKLATQTLYADGLGEPRSEGSTYQTMLMANTKALVQGLGGQYVAFKPIKSTSEQSF